MPPEVRNRSNMSQKQNVSRETIFYVSRRIMPNKGEIRRFLPGFSGSAAMIGGAQSRLTALFRHKLKTQAPTPFSVGSNIQRYPPKLYTL